MPRTLQSMDAAVAIGIALGYLKTCAKAAPLQGREAELMTDTIERLQEILDQRGCEHFDDYCREDGRLTSLIDVIIDG